MIDAEQLRDWVIVPTLETMGMHSEAAVNLLLGTCAQESHMGEYLHQINGPALGVFQMEPVTYRGTWNHYIRYRADLDDMMRAVFYADPGKPEQLIYDLRLAAAMCRLHYRRRPEPLPAADDVWGLAAYWKKHYNTEHGAGTVEEFVRNFELYVMTALS